MLIEECSIVIIHFPLC